MHVLEWGAYRNQILAGVGEVGRLTPDTVKVYVALSSAGVTTARLEANFASLSPPRPRSACGATAATRRMPSKLGSWA